MPNCTSIVFTRALALLAYLPLTLCLLGSLASPLLSQQTAARQCPDGVLDGERAYFGSTLQENSCSAPGEVCEEVFFISKQRHSAAVCSTGRWILQDDSSAVADSCPRFVFANGEIWNGSYGPNSCDAESAPLCQRTYFYRLPDGSSGYRTATCVDGEWQAGPEWDPGTSGDGEAFRLRQARSENELEAYLKEGLMATYGGGSPFLYGPFTGGVLSPPADPGDEVPLSETNVQEAGVDEEDRIKSDGRYLYVLKNHQSIRQPPPEPGGRNQIRILEIDSGQPSAAEISEIEITLDQYQEARGLYLRDEADQLIVTASSLNLGWFYWYSPLAWLDGQSTVASVDVSDPTQPEQAATLELDGEIISTRRIGDVLYLATRFHPYIDGLEPYVADSPDSAAAIARIQAASLDDLLPTYRLDAQSEPRRLVDSWNCYLPTEEAPIVAADIVTLVAVDLDTMDLVSSKCFVGATETLYVSLESIYVASTRYEYSLIWGEDAAIWVDYSQPKVETDLHKFSISDGEISYVASGSVAGHLGWNILRRPFRLSERGDDLRAITYTDELTPDRSPVAITVLRDVGDDELEVLSRLPNDERPDPLGKPGERLYATRFVGDRAYLVTFLVTDPLYVIDLSQPEDPFVAGELEITGFSDYLHPIDGGYLLGIGKDAIPDPFGDFRGAWYQGIKIALYDVSDPSSPFEADAVILGKRGSESQVLYDHRAFTFLDLAGANPRAAIGARVHTRLIYPTGGEPWTYYDWSYSGLHLFEIDTTAGRLLGQGIMRVEEYDPTINGPGTSWPIFGDDRSVLAGDAIFYVHGDDVFTALWSNPGAFEGPK